MVLQFSKFHGTGNDFIVIDNRNDQIHLSTKLINQLCARQTGIGADGLIMADMTASGNLMMRYFNADGHESTMCGNGGRCLAAWAVMNDNSGHSFPFQAIDGFHHAEVRLLKPGLYSVVLSMCDIGVFNKLDDGYFIDSGSPHFVRFVEEPEAVDVISEGHRLRFDMRFQPAGVNVNFVRIRNERIIIRTYERGVENETLSCGTGVTAAAIAAMLETGSEQDEWLMETKGGELKVSVVFDGKLFKNIILEGPAKFVFKGEINL